MGCKDRIMEKCVSIQEGVRSALELYEIIPAFQWEFIEAGEQDDTDILVLDGKRYPLFWWREDAQVSALINGGISRNTCSIKINRAVKKSYGLQRLMYREFDIAEQIARSEINDVACFQKGNSANLIATMKNGVVACFELSACLNEETDDQGRRSLWGTDGMMSDRVVAHKLSGEEIYLFTDEKKEPQTFTDLFIHMYGLNKTEVYKATYITRILMGEINVSNVIETDLRLKKNVEMAIRSAQTEDRVYIKEME